MKEENALLLLEILHRVWPSLLGLLCYLWFLIDLEPGNPRSKYWLALKLTSLSLYAHRAKRGRERERRRKGKKALPVSCKFRAAGDIWKLAHLRLGRSHYRSQGGEDRNPVPLFFCLLLVGSSPELQRAGEAGAFS